MQELTDDQRHRKSQCITDQEKFVSDVIGAIIDVKTIHDNHAKITQRVIAVEIESAENKAKISQLQEAHRANSEKILEELNASREFRERLEPWITTAKPYMNTIEFWSGMPIWPKRFLIVCIACTIWVTLSALNPSISPNSAFQLIKSWAGI